MLVLSRKPGERLVLTVGSLTANIQILAVSRNRVRVGIDAPKQIGVARAEVLSDQGDAPRLRGIA